MEEFPIILLTGLSGAGKSTALNVLEDMRYFTVDGLPPELLPDMAKVLTNDTLPQYRGLIMGVDLRMPYAVRELEKSIDVLNIGGFAPRVFFVEANHGVIMSRYMTTRRPHPLESEGMGLEQAIHKERERLARIRELAWLVLDTSAWSIHDLRRHIQKKDEFLRETLRNFKLHLISFGFKYGIPAEADMMLDLRFLPNPYFEDDLRAMSGLEPPVSEYVLQSRPGSDFMPRLIDFFKYLLPLYESEGRYRLTIAFGCTGGRHRSVAVTEASAQSLKALGYAVTVEHRHLELG